MCFKYAVKEYSPQREFYHRKQVRGEQVISSVITDPNGECIKNKVSPENKYQYAAQSG